MSKTISATFKTVLSARDALAQLEAEGFSEEDISLIAADNTIGHSFNIEREDKASEGGFIGATTGGIIGAIAAGLAATGSLVIPGINLLVYGTAIAAAAGAGVGAAAGGLVGALIGLGIPEYEAKRYENEVKNGNVLIVVEARDSTRAEAAKRIFERSDAYNIAA